MIPFLRAFVFGFGVFGVFLGLTGKLYGVGDNSEILWAIGMGIAALAIRFTVLRHRSPESAK